MKFAVFVAVLFCCVTARVNQTCIQQNNQTFGVAAPPGVQPRNFNNFKEIMDSFITSSFRVSKIKLCTSDAGQTTGINLQLSEWNGTTFRKNPIILTPIGYFTNKDNCQTTELESPIQWLQIWYDKTGLTSVRFSDQNGKIV